LVLALLGLLAAAPGLGNAPDFSFVSVQDQAQKLQATPVWTRKID